jgi:nicotinamide mononucleotide transporter
MGFKMAEISKWFILHFQEIIGTIISLIYLYFSIIQNKWLWPLGLVSSAIYALIFFKAGIYADMGLQIYYVVISIYGWFVWIKIQNTNSSGKGTIKSVLGSNFLILWLLIASSVIFIILSQLLMHFTDSTIPYIDAFITALSITATWMLAKKYIEHWLVWIVVDTVSAGVYYYKGLYVTILLYSVYTIFAVAGYLMWLNSFRKQKSDLMQNKTMAF